MRVVAGIARGVSLRVPVRGVRPTSDRVREALFSVLGECVVSARCLDLFAGSGALGIEALSRGAESCLFVDKSQESCEVISANLEKTKLKGGEIQITEVGSFLCKSNAAFDLVFADPPYAEQGKVGFAEKMAVSKDLVRLILPGGTLVLESGRSEKEYPFHEGIDLLSMREYGDTRLAFYRRMKN